MCLRGSIFLPWMIDWLEGLRKIIFQRLKTDTFNNKSMVSVTNADGRPWNKENKLSLRVSWVDLGHVCELPWSFFLSNLTLLLLFSLLQNYFKCVFQWSRRHTPNEAYIFREFHHLYYVSNHGNEEYGNGQCFFIMRQNITIHVWYFADL